MENIITGLKKRQGYISIETIIVAGLVVGLGSISIGGFGTTADGVSTKSINSVSKIQNQFN